MKRFNEQFRAAVAVGALSLAATLIVSTAALASESRHATNDPTYQQECGSCHPAYLAKMLPASSWRAVMAGLDKHFGTDASLDEKTRVEISSFLEKHAGKRDAYVNGKPLLRITETRWFVHEHSEELPRNIWKHPAVKTPANCAACHTAAEKGEHTLRLPKGVRE